MTYNNDLRRPNIAFLAQIQLLAEELADERDVLRIKEAVDLIHD